MPTLKQLCCRLEWSGTSVPLKEYATTYTDGLVQCYVAVPDTPQPFMVHLTSRGYIAPGVAMFVFIDGVYQCNRNRKDLQPPGVATRREDTEIDFKVRQKEERSSNGNWIGMPWRFEKLNIVSDYQNNEKPTTPDNVEEFGTIEVVVLRCQSDPNDPRVRVRGEFSTPETANLTKASRGNGNKGKQMSKRAPSPQPSIASVEFGFGLFDGAADYERFPSPRSVHFNPNVTMDGGYYFISDGRRIGGYDGEQDDQYRTRNWRGDERRRTHKARNGHDKDWTTIHHPVDRPSSVHRNSEHTPPKEAATININVNIDPNSNVKGEIDTSPKSRKVSPKEGHYRGRNVSKDQSPIFPPADLVQKPSDVNYNRSDSWDTKSKSNWDLPAGKEGLSCEHVPGEYPKSPPVEDAECEQCGSNRVASDERKIGGRHSGNHDKASEARREDSGGSHPPKHRSHRYSPTGCKHRDDKPRDEIRVCSCGRPMSRDPSPRYSDDARDRNHHHCSCGKDHHTEKEDVGAPVDTNENNLNDQQATGYGGYGEPDNNEANNAWDEYDKPNEDRYYDTNADNENQEYNYGDNGNDNEGGGNEYNYDYGDTNNNEDTSAQPKPDALPPDVYHYAKSSWSAWNVSAGDETFPYKKGSGRSIHSDEDVFSIPEEEAVELDVREELVRQNAISHRLQPGKPIRYTHKVGKPIYLDTLEEPYAVFVFKYRSKDSLRATFNIDIDDIEEQRGKFHTLTKDQLIEELLRVKTAAARGGVSLDDDQAKENEDEKQESARIRNSTWYTTRSETGHLNCSDNPGVLPKRTPQKRTVQKVDDPPKWGPSRGAPTDTRSTSGNKSGNQNGNRANSGTKRESSDGNSRRVMQGPGPGHKAPSPNIVEENTTPLDVEW